MPWRSEPLRANEGVGQVGEEEQGHCATESVFDEHLSAPLLQRRASFRTHKGRCKFLILRIELSENRVRFSGRCARGCCTPGRRQTIRRRTRCLWRERQCPCRQFLCVVATDDASPGGSAGPDDRNGCTSRPQAVRRVDESWQEYGSEPHKGSREAPEERNRIPIGIRLGRGAAADGALSKLSPANSAERRDRNTPRGEGFRFGGEEPHGSARPCRLRLSVSAQRTDRAPWSTGKC
jgi:hypothetical protein